MKVFLAFATLVSLVASRPTCSRHPTPSITPVYGNTGSNGTNTTTPSAGSSNSTSTRLASGWYPGWSSDTLSPSQIPWGKYTSLTYAFALTTPDVNQLNITDPESVLTDFVSQAHSHSVKALISVGGWTGSRFFSSAVATTENRTAFTKTLMDFASKYQFDGIDFDWEFPNGEGLSCNVVSANDSANFLELLKEVRQKAGNDFQLTAAVRIQPFNGPDGTPMSDVSEFAKVLNHIAIMAYDINGPSWSTVAGPNAPLQDSCAPTQNQQGSCASSVKAWTEARFPANQILLGVPSYGYGFTVESSAIGGDAQKLAQFPSSNKDLVPPGTGETSDTQNTDVCGVASGPSGTFAYSDLVQRGFIDSKGTPASGLLSQFDNCSQTVYIYNSTSQVLINFDSTDTFKAKGNFINEQNLAGFAMWDIASDTSDGALADAIVSAM